MFVAASIEGVVEATRALTNALDDEIADALERIATRIALAARTEHSFTNRTGKLEASISIGTPVGSWVRGSLRINIFARTPYASYVEDVTGGSVFYPGPGGELIEAGKWSYLARAWGEHADETMPTVDLAINNAISRAGW
jgi:hypothetical protein